MKSILVILGLSAGFAGVGVPLLLYRTDGEAPAPRKAKRWNYCPTEVAANGIIEGARPEVALRTEVTGRIAAIHARENQDVRRGDVLVELDSDTHRHEVALADLPKRLEQDRCLRHVLDRFRATDLRAPRRHDELVDGVSLGGRYVHAQAGTVQHDGRGLAVDQEVEKAQRLRVQPRCCRQRDRVVAAIVGTLMWRQKLDTKATGVGKGRGHQRGGQARNRHEGGIDLLEGFKGRRSRVLHGQCDGVELGQVDVFGPHRRTRQSQPEHS